MVSNDGLKYLFWTCLMLFNGGLMMLNGDSIVFNDGFIGIKWELIWHICDSMVFNRGLMVFNGA